MRDDMHLTPELLRALAAGRLRPQVFVQFLRHHLREVCPTCRKVLEEYAGRKALPARARLDALGVLAALEPAAKAADERAEDLLAELRDRSPAERLERLYRGPDRFFAEPVLDAILEESRACLPADPGGSLAWAELALAILDLHPAPNPAHQVLATAHQANGWRITGDLPAAAQGLAAARRLLLERGVADTETSARLDSLQASLYVHLHRFEDAEALLTRAATLYQLLRRRAETGSILLQLSNLYAYQGLSRKANDMTRQALTIFDPEEDPRLYLMARYNLAHDYLETGSPELAQDLLAYDADLYERHADLRTQLHVTWLEGRIAHAQDRLQEAERAFVAVREGYTLEGQVYDVGMVSLDLALLYYQQHRTDELAQVASEAVALFRASGVERDAMAALLLLQEAIQADELTAATIQQALRQLKEAVRSLRFPGGVSAC